MSQGFASQDEDILLNGYHTEVLPRYGKTLLQIYLRAEVIGSILFDDSDPEIERWQNIIKTQLNPIPELKNKSSQELKR